MRRNLGAICLALVFSAAASPGRAQMPVWVARLLRTVPVTAEECAVAHAQSAAASLQVAVGDPLEIPDFADRTIYDVTIEEVGKLVKKRLEYEYSRLGVFTYGMALTADDQQNLPTASKARILERIDSNYISMQVRLQRAADGGEPYLYFKPFAAVGIFNREASQEFHPLMESSVRDVRGLGLFVKTGTPITAEVLRTFVAVNKDIMVRTADDGSTELVPHYELIFVRARFDGGEPTLHSFVTNEHRTLVNYLAPYKSPTKPEECTFLSTIFFTDYTVAKQSPSAKATRVISIDTRGRFEVAALDAYAASTGLEGGAFANLTETLDAIIDGKVEPRETGRVTTVLTVDPRQELEALEGEPVGASP